MQSKPNSCFPIHNKMKKSILYILPVVLMLSCSEESTPAADQSASPAENTIQLNDVQASALQIETDSLRKEKISAVIRLNGRAELPPQNMFSVSVPVGGYLKTLNILPGKLVRKGEILATLEDPAYVQLQQDYLVANQELKMQESEYLRLKALNQNKASSDKELVQAQTAYESTKIACASLQEKLRLIHIDGSKLNASSISSVISLPAPSDGMITEVNAHIGQYLNPSDIIYSLSRSEGLYLKLLAFEKDLPYLHVGQAVVAESSSTGTSIQANISYINSNLQENGSAEVIASVESGSNNLIPGQYLQAEIHSDENVRYVMPEESIVHFEGQDFIFLQGEKNEYTMQQITTGVNTNGLVELTNPEFLAGKRIVTKGAYSLLMTMKNKAE